MESPLDRDEFRRWRDEADVALPDDVEAALRRLSRHYIPARYPDAHPTGPAGLHYGDSDAEEAIRDARCVHEFIDDAWRRFGG